MKKSVCIKIDDLFIDLCEEHVNYSHFCGYCTALMQFGLIDTGSYRFIVNAAFNVVDLRIF